MGPEGVGIGLVVLGVFAALFAFGIETLQRSRSEGGVPLLTQIAGIVTPFLFALYFAGSAELDVSLWALLALLAPLAAAAAVLARVHAQPGLEAGVAAAELAVLVAATMRAAPSRGFTLELLGTALALTAIHLFFAHRDARGERPSAFAPTALLAAGVTLLSGFQLSQTATAAEPQWLLIRVIAWLLLYSACARVAQLASRRLPELLGGAALAIALTFALVRADDVPGLQIASGLAVAGVAILIGVALSFRAASLHRRALRDPDGSAPHLHGAVEWSAALLPLLVLASFGASNGLRGAPVLLFHLACGALALLVVLAALRRRTAWWLLIVVPVLFLAHAIWANDTVSTSVRGGAPLLAILFQLTTITLLASLPLIPRRPFTRPPVWIAAALYPAAWFMPGVVLWEHASEGEGWAAGWPLALMPLLLAAIALVPLSLAARKLVGSARTSALAWLASVALGLVAVAVPMQIEREWLTVGWALQALGVVLLWRRLDHPGLKAFAGLLFAIVFVRLTPFNEALFLQYPQAERFAGLDLPVLNWLLYTYGIAVAALLLAARWLADLEVARARAWERFLYAAGRPLFALAFAGAAILLVFVWLNLTIYEAFSPAGSITIAFDHNPARDLTLSLGWGVYALMLLGLGVWRRSTALRWLSLAFLLLTLAKAFLYDLGQLEDLYRVASLLALAVSLIAVSLLYQRFVFRRRDEDRERIE
jgi:hypothetical protein